MPHPCAAPPKYSIIIPVKAINEYIREVVSHVLNLQRNDWELLIVPNIAAPSEWEDKRIKILSSGRVGPAQKRDLGSKIATGEFLVFLDDDSYPAVDYLNIPEIYFSDLNVVALGGPGITPESDSFMQQVSGAAFLSKFSGGAPERYQSVGAPRVIEDWPSVNFIIRKSIFHQIGGFDCEFWPGEDTKLCNEIVRSGVGKMLYVPNLIVWHHRRGGFLLHMQQVGQYGKHRGYFFKRFPKTSRRIKYCIPSAFFLFAIFSLPIMYCIPAMVLPIALIWVLYFFALVKSWFDIVEYVKPTIAFCAIPYIVGTHFCYGAKFIQGLLTGNLKSKLR